MMTSGITREELIAWGGAETFNQALAICNSNDISEVKYDDEAVAISAKVTMPSGYAPRVTVRLQPGGRIKSDCPCEKNSRYSMVCPHAVAVGLAQYAMEMEEADRVERERRAAEEEDAPPPDDTEYIEIPMSPKFYAYVAGTRGSLSVALDVYYGDEINFPACSLQADRTVYLKDPDDDLVRRVRSLKAEQEAFESLKREWGFEPGYKEGDLRLYLTSPVKVLNFLGAGLPAIRRRGWEVELSERLEKLTDEMPSVLPTVKVKKVGADFDVQITFDALGSPVPAAEIQAAVNRHDGYIMRDGQTVLLDNHAIEQMSAVLADCAVGTGDAPPGWVRFRGVYAPYVQSSFDLLDVLDVGDRDTESWIAEAARRNDRRPDAKFEPVALGPLEKVLRPYQKQGVYWMRFLEEAGLCGLLADEMGLGKTLQTLTWLSLPNSSQTSQASQPSLIVCPTSLVRNWEAEAKKFTPWLKTLVVSGPERARSFSRFGEADLVITSYALLQRDFEDAYLNRQFDAIVIDEAQHIKNAGTKNAKAVKLLKARRRLALTGTPVENTVMDVWSIFDYLMPDYLGDHDLFKAVYEEPIRNGGGEAELARLKRKIRPFILRRVKKLVARDLPDKIVKVSYCPMDEETQREYLTLAAETRSAAGGLIKAKGLAKSKFEILAMLMKLRKLASRGKQEAFLEQLRSAIEGGHKILVFSQFVTTLKSLAEALEREGVGYAYLDGSTKNRLDVCNRFNRDPKQPVFLISLMAGGTGLNLTGADMVMHYDPWWNPAVEDQATDRAHRIGQKKTVYVMKMVASNTVEERVIALQRKKQAVISATIETSDAAVMESLTAADIGELLK